MPSETRNYVPKLQAVKNIVLAPDRYGLVLPPLENHPYFLGVPIERDIDVALAARLAGLPVEEFQFLNPQLNKPVILAAATPQVLLPYDNANRYLNELAQVRGPLSSWTAWVAPRTVKPSEAARLAGVSESQLREVNLIPARMLVKAGSTLLVPRPAHVTADVAEQIAEHGVMELAPEAKPLRRVAFKAGPRGDSVAAVARRYGVAPALVARWNGAPAQGRFRAGQQVVVMLASAPAHKAARPAPVRRYASRPAPRLRIAQAGPR
jgi:membrane-bound lytic murein transglycosylase D